MTTTPTAIPFDSNTTAYSLNNAYWLAQAASIAYQEKSAIQRAVAKLGLEDCKFLSKEDTHEEDISAWLRFHGRVAGRIVDFLSRVPMDSRIIR